MSSSTARPTVRRHQLYTIFSLVLITVGLAGIADTLREVRTTTSVIDVGEKLQQIKMLHPQQLIAYQLLSVLPNREEPLKEIEREGKQSFVAIVDAKPSPRRNVAFKKISAQPVAIDAFVEPTDYSLMGISALVPKLGESQSNERCQWTKCKPTIFEAERVNLTASFTCVSNPSASLKYTWSSDKGTFNWRDDSDKGTFNWRDDSRASLNTSGLAGQTLNLTISVTGCGELCSQTCSRLVVKPETEIIVEVRGDGKSLSGATVEITGHQRQTTDKSGLATFRNVKQGDYDISVQAKEFYSAKRTVSSDGFNPVRVPITLDIIPGTRDPKLVVSPPPTPQPSRGGIDVTVRGRSGGPFKATVTLDAQSPRHTDDNGTLTFRDLDVGTYLISIEADGYKKVEQKVSVAASEITKVDVQMETAPSLDLKPPTDGPSEGRNGGLTVIWPAKLNTKRQNVCHISYAPPSITPPDLLPGHTTLAAFALTNQNGLVTEPSETDFQPLDLNRHEWTMSVIPAAEAEVATADVVMRVRFRSRLNGDIVSRELGDIPIQSVSSSISVNWLSKRSQLGGSGLCIIFGTLLLGIGNFNSLLLFRDTIPERLFEIAKKPLSKVIEVLWNSLHETHSAASGPFVISGRTHVGRTVRKPPQEEPRFTDLTIYKGHIFRSDLATADKITDNTALVSKATYTLEVAIRSKRTGIKADVPAPRQVLSRRQGRERVTLHVLATPIFGIVIENRFSKISWDYNKDSEPAVFKFYVEPHSGATPTEGKIEVRILDEGLNLLDILNLGVTIVAHEMQADQTTAMRLEWPEREAKSLQILPGTKPRLGAIHVRPITSGFEFEFVFSDPSGRELKVPIYRYISTDDLNGLLRRVRNFWLRLVIKNYADALSVTRSTYGSYLNELRQLGTEAWSLLFGDRTMDQKGASEILGEFIAKLDASDGDSIQISYGIDGSQFIFPWSILYALENETAEIDPLRFWGARYQIEQVREGPSEDGISETPVTVLFALDSSFEKSNAQRQMFEDYKASAHGLKIHGPISDEKGLFDGLIQDPSAHLIYFYCHGYAANQSGPLDARGVDLLKKLIEESPANSPLAKALETLKDLISKMAGESWIYLGDSEVKEIQLRKREDYFKERRPIVFLNMCQSADLYPSLSSGLVRVFLDKNASAVIGTESPMSGIFAHEFAKRVFDELFAGNSIGNALRQARRHFLEKSNNPLGLAYTLYGRAHARLGNGPIVPPIRRKDAAENLTRNHAQ